MFGTELKRLRLKAGLTQEQVAARAKVTREYVSMLEAGKYVPTIEVFIRLVRAVDASPSEVIATVERSLVE
ncbi:MAG TPA: helix-turn-helix transcriptional regulator [Tepidisphaeraceae bacterium]|nr:helix-turn-helix transcriptional regulator [Tepidisphaeraceae bacterium]